MSLKLKSQRANVFEADDKEASVNNNIVYYICGYLILMLKKGCQSCLDTLECGVDALPINFTAHQLTESKDKGNLRFLNWNVFKLLSVVEKSVLDAYESGEIFQEISIHCIH